MIGTATGNEKRGVFSAPAARFRALLAVGFLAVAAGLSGCIIDSGPSRPVDCALERVVVFDWEIVKNANDVPLSCAQAAASSIILDMGTMVADFPCPGNLFGGREVSDPVNPGTYSTALQLIGSNGQVLSDTSLSPAGRRNVTVPQCAAANLGLVTFGTP